MLELLILLSLIVNLLLGLIIIHLITKNSKSQIVSSQPSINFLSNSKEIQAAIKTKKRPKQKLPHKSTVVRPRSFYDEALEEKKRVEELIKKAQKHAGNS